MTRQQRTPEIFLSMPHPCSYVPGRTATTLFVDPRWPLDNRRFGSFMQLGWRRSGDLVYRPHCRDCNACVPVRIPAARFLPDRGQRRVWRRNRNLRVVERPPVYDEAHFALYLRYQAARHPGGGMDDPDPNKYMEFLTGRHTETLFYELRDGDRLLGVAVTDHLPDGLSAVYTFYDPSQMASSPGIYAVMWQVHRAQELNLPYVYLGYWISESPKMAYKANFRPLEAFQDGSWRDIPDSGARTP
jgi:arginyl-tRNA--protein-N-Asp/Glu arginylyltransferase